MSLHLWQFVQAEEISVRAVHDPDTFALSLVDLKHARDVYFRACNFCDKTRWVEVIQKRQTHLPSLEYVALQLKMYRVARARQHCKDAAFTLYAVLRKRREYLSLRIPRDVITLLSLYVWDSRFNDAWDVQPIVAPVLPPLAPPPQPSNKKCVLM